MRLRDQGDRSGILGMSPGRALLAATVATDLFVAALLGLPLLRGLDEHRAAAAASAGNLAHLLELSLASVIDKTDLALQAVVDEHQRQQAAGGPLDLRTLQEAMGRQKARLPDVLALRYVDPRGLVQASAPAGGEGAVAGDRDFFVALRDDPASGFFLSRPYVGRIARRPVMAAGRRLGAEGGPFAGVVVGIIDLKRLEALLGSVNVGPHGVVSLRWTDLSLVARSSPVKFRVEIGDRRAPRELQARYQGGALAGTLDATSQLDGVRRTYAYRTLRGYPLVISAGLAPEDYLVGWRRQRLGAAGVLLGFVLLSGAGTWAILRAWRRRMEHERLLEERTAELRESEERFRLAFQTSPEAIALTRRADGTYVAINEGFTRMTGWAEEELVGRSSLDVGIWADPADRDRVVKGLAEQGAVVNLQAEFRGKRGQAIACLFSARPMRVRGEDLLISVSRDVTELKRTEAERDQLRERLQETQRLEGLGRLAGGVAHDFNNLLTVILSCCEALREELAGRAPEQLELVDQVRGAGERARDLTRQLLAFARKQVVAPRVLELGAVLRDAERLVRRVLGEDVALVVEVAPGDWPVRCDPGQLDQALMNLAVNARDAMPDGGTLTLALRGDPPAWVRLEVRDTGIGISPEVRAHLFEPFFTTKEKGKGTGLGLATVHGIVAQAGGRIEVHSAPGEGTTFAILLPRSEAAPDPIAAPPHRAAAGGSETVLVVEDDPQVRAVTVRALQGAGYQLLVAGSGPEALALVERDGRRLDLVVTDVIMPGPTGPEVVEALHRLRPGLRVLYVSGYPEDAMERRGVGQLGTAFLPKPFTAAALLERARAVLDAPAPARAPGQEPPPP